MSDWNTTDPSRTSDEIGAAILGRSIHEAVHIAWAGGWQLRPIEIDGEARAITCEYKTDRINVAIRDGIVVEVTGVG